MVKEKEGFYVCEICSFKYETSDLAQQCEKFCKENNSCSLEITKHAVQ